MASFKGQTGNDWPVTKHTKLIENDPQIVKVPMDNVDFGARKGTMAKARNSDGYKEQKLGIKHVGDSKKGP